MGQLLYIPWFKLEQIDAPRNMLIGALLAMCALAAVNPRWRGQAGSMAMFVAIAGFIAFVAGYDIIPIQPFGILVASGVVLGTKYSEWYAKNEDIDPVALGDFVTHVVGIGFIGAVVLNAIFYETDALIAFLQDPAENVRWMGLSSYGGFLGAIFGLWVWKKRNPELRAWPLADTVCFGFPLGWMLGRTGCFTVHDHPGQITDFFLGVENYYEQGVVRHDLGLYEVIHAAIVVIIFYVIYKKWPKPQRPMGLWVGLMPLLYTPVRFCLDFLRATDLSSSDVRYGHLTPAQYASIGMFFMSLYLLRQVFKNPEWNIPPALRYSTRLRSATRDEEKDETKASPDEDKVSGDADTEPSEVSREGADNKSGKSSSSKKRKKKKK